MAIPFLPLLGAAARVLGTRAFMAMRGRKLAAAFAGNQSVNIVDLARRLGTPVPSAAQIKTEQIRMAQQEFMASITKSSKSISKVAFLGLAAHGASVALEKFSASLINRRQAFEHLNSGIAALFAQIRRQELVLGVKTGAAIEPSTKRLGKAWMALQEDIQPLKETGMRLFNVVGTGLIQFLRGWAMIQRPFAWLVAKALDWFEKDEGSNQPGVLRDQMQGELRHFFNQMKNGHFGNPINQRPGASRRLP